MSERMEYLSVPNLLNILHGEGPHRESFVVPRWSKSSSVIVVCAGILLFSHGHLYLPQSVVWSIRIPPVLIVFQICCLVAATGWKRSATCCQIWLSDLLSR
ncbi:hypothetical protein KP509_26G031800 [Ceratopteris richardii]|uniref:Uncharacterized protein n=1 Tax=Ceratopteris richardii TaxID=49495 RepID=A0A8T2RLS4_CERRI|nr:hypothetical protein KP509_26G031800 [Ceratopteris richardii]